MAHPCSKTLNLKSKLVFVISKNQGNHVMDRCCLKSPPVSKALSTGYPYRVSRDAMTSWFAILGCVEFCTVTTWHYEPQNVSLQAPNYHSTLTSTTILAPFCFEHTRCSLSRKGQRDGAFVKGFTWRRMIVGLYAHISPNAVTFADNDLQLRCWRGVVMSYLCDMQWHSWNC